MKLVQELRDGLPSKTLCDDTPGDDAHVSAGRQPLARQRVRRIFPIMSPARRRAESSGLDRKALRDCQRRFTAIFPRRFRARSYVEWERAYKWQAHELWQALLNRDELGRLLANRAYLEIGARAMAVYARPKLNLLALYEWMALREALADPAGARRFAPALQELIYGRGSFGPRFDAFVAMLDGLPQRQSRVAKWPVATLYSFIALPSAHLHVKPNLIKRVSSRFGVDLGYRPRPSAATYAAILRIAHDLRDALRPWRPRDFIDIQGFLWVTHSDEYAEWPWD